MKTLLGFFVFVQVAFGGNGDSDMTKGAMVVHNQDTVSELALVSFVNPIVAPPEPVRSNFGRLVSYFLTPFSRVACCLSRAFESVMNDISAFGIDPVDAYLFDSPQRIDPRLIPKLAPLFSFVERPFAIHYVKIYLRSTYGEKLSSKKSPLFYLEIEASLFQKMIKALTKVGKKVGNIEFNPELVLFAVVLLKKTPGLCNIFSKARASFASKVPTNPEFQILTNPIK